jgi:hypothetical protein
LLPTPYCRRLLQTGETAPPALSGADLAENEEWMEVNIDRTSRRRKSRDKRTTLAEEEEILKIMHWNTVPTKLQRELFDCASTIGDSQQANPLKGRMARFLHNHKNDTQALN